MSETAVDRIGRISVLADEVNKAREELAAKEKALIEYVNGIQSEINDAKVKAGIKASSPNKITYGRGERTAEVERHYRDGKTVEEIASEMKIPPNIVKRLIYKIKSDDASKRLLQSVEDKNEGEEDVKKLSVIAHPDKATKSSPVNDEDDSGAASTQQLLDAMGTKKITTFKTTKCRGHQHVAQVDIFGAGRTLADGSGHSHRIRNFDVTTQSNHTHSLTTASGGEVTK